MSTASFAAKGKTQVIRVASPRIVAEIDKDLTKHRIGEIEKHLVG
jgi:protein required for attachment to host cells